MSTRAYILKDTDKGFYGVYLHNDAYPENVKEKLIPAFTKPEDVDSLLANGNMSILGRNICPDQTKEHSFKYPQKDVCVYYHRDRDEAWEYNKPNYLTFTDLRLRNVNYCYIYGKDNNWYYMNESDIDSVDSSDFIFMKLLESVEDLPW